MWEQFILHVKVMILENATSFDKVTAINLETLLFLFE